MTFFTREDRTNKEQLLKLAILSVSLVTSFGNTAAVILSRLREEFPGTDTVAIQSFANLQQLSIMICTILSGILCAVFSKKKLVRAGLWCILVFGLLPVILHAYPPILLTRIGFGAGLGILTPLSLALIADHFSGEERAAMSGRQFAFFNIGQALTMLGAGALVSRGWRSVSVLYLLALPVLVIVILYLPEDAPARPSKAAPARAQGKLWNLPVLGAALVMFVYNTAFVTLYSYLSLMLTDEGIAPDSFTGYGFALMSLAGMAAGLSFGRIFKGLRHGAGPLALFLTAAGFVLLSGARSAAGVLAALFVAGLGNSVVMSYLRYLLMLFAPEGGEAFCVALSSVMNSIGHLLVPYIFGMILLLLHAEGSRSVFRIAALVMAVLALTLAAGAALRHSRGKNLEE